MSREPATPAAPVAPDSLERMWASFFMRTFKLPPLDLAPTAAFYHQMRWLELFCVPCRRCKRTSAASFLASRPASPPPLPPLLRWCAESTSDGDLRAVRMQSSCQVIISLCRCGRIEIRVLIQLVSITPPGPTHLPSCMQDTLEVLEVRLPSVLLVCLCGFPLTFCTCLQGMAHGTCHCLSVCKFEGSAEKFAWCAVCAARAQARQGGPGAGLQQGHVPDPGAAARCVTVISVNMAAVCDGMRMAHAFQRKALTSQQ